MKGIQAKLARAGVLFVFAVILNACTTPPITIGIDPVTIDLPAAWNTLNQVIIPKNPVSLQKPPPGTSIASVKISGKAELKKEAAISFEFYATDTDPKTLGCNDNGEYYVCDPETDGLEKVSKEPIEFENSKGPVPFTLSGDKLASGINKNSLYMGVKVGGTLTFDNELTLSDLKATIQLNVGK